MLLVSHAHLASLRAVARGEHGLAHLNPSCIRKATRRQQSHVQPCQGFWHEQDKLPGCLFLLLWYC